MKVLFVATVVKTHIMTFHLPTIKMFHDAGWEVHVAAKNDYIDPEECDIPDCDAYYDIPFSRSPFSANTIRAYQKLKRLIWEQDYDLVYCHTPVGGVLARLAARKLRASGTKVIYMAHGFHFYKGAPFKNWLLYYPAERICSRWTDKLLTINEEDYRLAIRHFHAGEVQLIPGVGIDTEKYHPDRTGADAKRLELQIPEDAFLLLSAGELNDNKNHGVVIDAMARLKKCPKIYYAIAGYGDRRDYLKSLVSAKALSDRVLFLGYRNDIAELCRCADVFVHPSIREGLPVSVMEAMATGLPVICSDIRGNHDLIRDHEGGLLCAAHDVQAFAEAIEKLYEDPALRSRMGARNQERAQRFSQNSITRMIGEACGIFKEERAE